MIATYILAVLVWVSPPIPEENEAIINWRKFGLSLEQCEKERARIVASIAEPVKGNVVAFCFPDKMKDKQ